MALIGAVLSLTGCQHSEKKAVDQDPLPTVAEPPYVCGYIPTRAVELMTGVRDPLVRGSFDLSVADGLGAGGCAVYQPEGERLQLLQIQLTPGGFREAVEEQVAAGASPLPEIVPGAVGYYFASAHGEDNDAHALLVRGKAEINIALEIGVEGRDNAADVLALMKLIAPRLITDASAPSASPSASGKG
ncbi:hypothetical protein [Microbispora sp. H11081]|uniref:hypothetical protein n=1 Tax=Microbispora sp. H11081 TaxID=2729107 RepID=UPI00147521A9|nr:hypothetical protein [Microbispora sp. H11081]